MNALKNTGSVAISTVALILLLPFFSSGHAIAQEEGPQAPDARSTERSADGADGDLIRRLNLTPDQIRRIREIRQENAEEMRNNRIRLMRAQRALDEAIYSDSVDEATVEGRARDLAAAQSSIARLRALTELRIRRLLTSEQLNLLRGMRQQARERVRDNPRVRRQNPNAFQDRQKLNVPPSNPTNVRPGSTVTKPGTSTTDSRKP
jgi:Spy/CpxP family protein refolding chaperone